MFDLSSLFHTLSLSLCLFRTAADSFESLVHSLRFFVAGINFSHKVWQTLDLHINDLGAEYLGATIWGRGAGVAAG